MIFRISDGDHVRHDIVDIAPLGIEMHKVAAAIGIVDEVGDGRLDAKAAGKALETVGRMPPVSVLRFAIMAAAGAAALGVIFGTRQWLTLAVIGLSAFAGACLRRWLSGKTHNPVRPTAVPRRCWRAAWPRSCCGWAWTPTHN